MAQSDANDLGAYFNTEHQLEQYVTHTSSFDALKSLGPEEPDGPGAIKH